MVPERRLTILQILPALDAGGVERGTLEVGKHLVDNGHRSIVISAGGRMVGQLLREGSEHHTWDIGRKSLWTLRLIPRLRRFLIDNQVDILHVRSRMPAWIGYLTWRSMPRRARPRFVTTVHGPYTPSAYSGIMTKGERVIVISEMIRDYVLKHYPATPADSLRLIYRGVDPARYPHGHKVTPGWLEQWGRQFPWTLDKRLITLPARITRWKGQEDFIEFIGALHARHPDIHGLIVGDTHRQRRKYMSELQAMVTDKGLGEAITFTGNRTDLREIMALSEMVVSFSREPEAFGRTTIEALSLGVPVLGYAHGGVGEQLTAVFPEGALAVGDWQAGVEKASAWLEARPAMPPTHPFTLARMLDATLGVYRELTRGE